MPLFDTVLIANRGEIAVRVIRTLRRLGIRSAAVYSDADADARHVQEADTAFRLGPAAASASYLSVPQVVAACRATGAQAVHPGYGFLSENAVFAAALAAEGIVFLGPPARAIEVMGDKITAKNAVAANGVPVVPGIAEPGLTDERLLAAAPGIGFPVLVKPSAGGGGKGMRVVHTQADLAEALRSARREARSSFGDDTLFLERFVLRPRHIEVQVMADRQGHVVHLGERECSLQRRHQKVIEEAPSPLLDAATRARIGAAACATARSVDYVGAGTVEFIVSADRPDEFFFMEMNTRLQVEHPDTEAVTGLDLVEWQLRVAAGEPLGFTQDDVTLTGHAVEARIYAEDPGREFLPTGGTVRQLREPTGPGVRVDSGLLPGSVVGSDYDPMLAKVIAHGDDRATALARLDTALADTVVLGLQTNVEFLRALLVDPLVRSGQLDTSVLDTIAATYRPSPAPATAVLTAAVAEWLGRWADDDPHDTWSSPTGWRVGDPAPSRYRVSSSAGDHTVLITGTPRAATAIVSDPADGSVREVALRASSPSPGSIALVVDGLLTRAAVAQDGDTTWVHVDGLTHRLRRPARRRGSAAAGAAGGGEITSPMPGAVIAVLIADGDTVTTGTPVVVVEAMKMEHTLRAPGDGVVSLLVASGDQVALDQPLARIAAATEVES